MDVAAASANTKVLLLPFTPGAIVQSGNDVATDVVTFHSRLVIEGDRDSIEAKRWGEAAVDAKDKVLEVGSDSVDFVSHLGTEGVKVASRLGAEGAEAAGKLGAAALNRGLALRARFLYRPNKRNPNGSRDDP